jgi:hypothetical protein
MYRKIVPEPVAAEHVYVNIPIARYIAEGSATVCRVVEKLGAVNTRRRVIIPLMRHCSPEVIGLVAIEGRLLDILMRIFLLTCHGAAIVIGRVELEDRIFGDQGSGHAVAICAGVDAPTIVTRIIIDELRVRDA